MLRPEGSDEEQRCAATDFVLANGANLNLSDEEAAVLASLITVVSLSDIAQVHDWRPERIRCRLIGAALVFGNLLDTGVHRWEAVALAAGRRPAVPEWLMLPHLCIRDVKVLRESPDERGGWRLLVKWWAPEPRRREAEEWLTRYLDAVCQGSTEVGLGRVSARLSWVEHPGREDQVKQWFPRGQLVRWPSCRTRNQERVVVLRRLLTANDAPVSLFRASCQWAIVNYIAPQEMCDALPKDSPDPLTAVLCSGESWDWDSLRSAAVKTARASRALHRSAVRLAVSPRRYSEKREEAFGRQAAAAIADLIRSGRCELPPDLSDEFFTDWCNDSSAWQTVAAETILGRPTVLGRKGCPSLRRRVVELLRSAVAEELAALVIALHGAVREEHNPEEVLRELIQRLAAGVGSSETVTQETERLSAILILARMLPADAERGSVIDECVEPAVNAYIQRAPASDTIRLLRQLTMYWSPSPPDAWLRTATRVVGTLSSSDERTVDALLQLTGGFLGNLAHQEGVRRRLAESTVTALRSLVAVLDGLERQSRRELTARLAKRCRELAQSLT